MQEARIKALEADLERQRKKKEEIEKAKKYDENRFFKSRDGHFWVDLPSLVTWI